MFKKNTYLLLVLLCFGGVSNAQSDSTDLNFYSSTPIYENADDSLEYPSDMFSQYFLEFDLDDTISQQTIIGTDTTDAIVLEKIHIEISDVASGNVVFRIVYDIDDLQSQGLIVLNHVTLDLGIYEKYIVYSVLLTRESEHGALYPAIKKNL